MVQQHPPPETLCVSENYYILNEMLQIIVLTNEIVYVPKATPLSKIILVNFV